MRKRAREPTPHEPVAPPALSTRELLMSAALEILREEGWSGLSTVRLAEAAGIVQSGFYRHFPSVEACVGEAIGPISSGVRADVASRRRAWFADNPDDIAEAGKHYRDNMRIVEEHPVLGEILLKRRFERSPVGGLMRAFSEGLVIDMIEDITAGRLAKGSGTDSDRAHIASRIILGAVFGGIELLLEKRVSPELLGEALARVGAALGDGPWLEVTRHVQRSTKPKRTKSKAPRR